jgi:hypothetical protein
MGIMSYIGTKDLALEIPAGRVGTTTSVNKFGRATNVDSGVTTDIWDRANATADQDIWVAPTAARVHAIASTSDNDGKTGAPSSTGARTLRVYGLTAWNADEVSEDITLDGTTSVNTVNSYVIVHRMKVLTKGSSGPNVGILTATAATDATITAQINAGEGQTQMAIYGIPSTKVAYLTGFYASVLKANLSTNEVHADINVVFNPNPDSELTAFLIKHTAGCGTRAQSPFRHMFNPYNKFEGPGILKVQAAGSANDLDVSAGFDLILEDA